MRTTLSLDDDVSILLERVKQRSNDSMKSVVNKALRKGLEHLLKPKQERRHFETRSVNLGKCKLSNLDNIAEVLAYTEGEDFK